MAHEYPLNVMPVGVTELYCIILNVNLYILMSVFTFFLSPSPSSSRNYLSEETTYRVAVVIQLFTTTTVITAIPSSLHLTHQHQERWGKL